MKKIFLLGSGSSIGHSNGAFPSILGFFSVAHELGLYGGEDTKQIHGYVRNLFGRNIFSKHTKIDIEELFTLIEIEIERNPSPELLAIRNDLLKLIQEILIILEENLPENEGEYNLFLKKLNPSDTIITFNWDILLDNILSRSDILENRYSKKNYDKIESKQYENFVDKLSAFNEATWGGITFGPPYKEWSSKEGYYLKAHGSIDWLYCSNEACRAYRKVFPALDPRTKHFCSECHENLQLLIIPPVLNKGYRQYPVIRRIWNLAAKEMASVKMLVIWGYSLPPTDFYASWLLRLAREAPLERVVIINPEVISKNKLRTNIGLSFIRRFYDLFRQKISKEDIFLYETYRDYCNNMSIFEKYPLKSEI